MNKLYYLPLALGAAAVMGACASIGRPDGGPRDVEPPHFVSSNPAPGSLNVTGNKFSIYFNENVQLDDPGSRVAISPAQIQQPIVQANGRRVTVELKDSMRPNTTYTIDLADAVKDLNEGNVLDGFAIDFSTGEDIDTLAISGMVLQARNLEPAQGMLVGVYSTDADSAITTLPFERIARTNQLGEFTVRNLKPGSYQLFALTDLNRDLHWDRTEDVAFLSSLVVPSAEVREVTDSVAPDSIITRQLTTFLPDDLLLTWFNEDFKPQYLKNYKRDVRNIIELEMAAPADSLPELTIVGRNSRYNLREPLLDYSVLVRSATADTLKYWLRDSVTIATDSLLIETRYRRMDSLNNLVWQTDTLKFNRRTPKGKNAPKAPLTLQQKIDSVLALNDTIPVDTFALMQPSVWLDLSLASSVQDVNRPLLFSVNRPVDSIPPSGVVLEQCIDSVWSPVQPQPAIEWADTLTHMNMLMRPDWMPGGQYRLAVDSMAVTDIYGNYTRPALNDFKVRNLEDYCAVVFNVTGVPDSVQAVVELLDQSDSPVRTLPVAGGTVRFEFLQPATYYARLFIDRDRNGEWTNGNLLSRLQPEDVYYFPKKLALKKNWDRTEPWDINALSPELQKPLEIKANKPRVKAGEIPLPEEDDEEDDDYAPGYGYTPGYDSNPTVNRNTNRRL